MPIEPYEITTGYGETRGGSSRTVVPVATGGSSGTVAPVANPFGETKAASSMVDPLKPINRNLGYNSVYDGVVDPNMQRRMARGMPQVMTPQGWRWDAAAIRQAFTGETGENIIGNLSKVGVDENINFTDPKKDPLRNLGTKDYLDGANYYDAKDLLNQSGNPSGAGAWARYAVPAAAALAIGAGALAAGGAFGAGPPALGTGSAMPAGGAGLNALNPALFSAGSGVNVGTAAGVGAGTAAASSALSPASPFVGAGSSGAAGAGLKAAGAGVAAGGTLPTIKSAIEKYWPAAALGGLSAFTNYLGADEAADRADDLTQAEKDWYNEVSLPNSEAVNAARVQSRNVLSENRAGSYENMARSLAARGFGSGSGLGVGGAEAIEGDYLKSLGSMETELTKFANTRQFAPTNQQYSVPGGWEAALGTISDQIGRTAGGYTASQGLNPYGSASGMYAANQALPKANQTQSFF